MHRSLLKLLVVLALGIPFGACSGGSVSADKRAQPDCGVPGSESFCLTSCNLGCSQIGCSITDIAQNQPIILTFSQDVDPSPVNLSSISLKTAMGHEPVGSFVVQGSTVMFLPEVRLVGGASFFGFKANETYILRLSSGPDNINALRSTSGDPLVKTVECKLHVTRGVVDLDRRPPEAKLIVPAA
ncbi:MAG: Ig-like domain-containing protein, partial [Planctomycetota bacterium]|nr:Ig-like domain-containing protein [Planctomycetota bacterium]